MAVQVSQGGITVAARQNKVLVVSQGGITVAAHIYPDPPTNLAAVPSGIDSITLTWTNNYMDRTALWLQRGPNGVLWTDTIVIGLDSTGYVDTGLDPSTEYYYRIAAVYSGVVGTYSAAVNATTLTPSGGIFVVLRKKRRG